MNERARRPVSVTWLAVFGLTFTGWHGLRFSSTLRQWQFLSELPLSVPPLYLALSGLVWALLGSAITLGLFFGWLWAPRAARVGSLAFALFMWIDRLFLQASELTRTNQSFVFGSTLIVLGAILWILSRPGARAFFGEHDE